MCRFKVGDYVQIMDGSYVPHRFVAWKSSMDKLIGDVDVVACVYENCGIYTLRDCGMYMAEDWLAPVTAAEIEFSHCRKELEKEIKKSYMNNHAIFEDLLGNPYKPTVSLGNYFSFVPKIKKVIVNDPATVIIWEDGEKTVVKCGEHDTFDAEKGIAMAYIKRVMFANKTTQMNKWFKQYTDAEEEKSEVAKQVDEAVADSASSIGTVLRRVLGKNE